MNNSMRYEEFGGGNYNPRLMMERKNREYTLEPSDVIFATLSVRGKVIATVQGTGCYNFSDVLAWLKSKVDICRGAVTMFVRNNTRQWSYEKGYLFQGASRITASGNSCLNFSIS